MAVLAALMIYQLHLEAYLGVGTGILDTIQDEDEFGVFVALVWVVPHRFDPKWPGCPCARCSFSKRHWIHAA